MNKQIKIHQRVLMIMLMFMVLACSRFNDPPRYKLLEPANEMLSVIQDYEDVMLGNPAGSPFFGGSQTDSDLYRNAVTEYKNPRSVLESLQSSIDSSGITERFENANRAIEANLRELDGRYFLSKNYKEAFQDLKKFYNDYKELMDYALHPSNNTSGSGQYLANASVKITGLYLTDVSLLFVPTVITLPEGSEKLQDKEAWLKQLEMLQTYIDRHKSRMEKD